jgi:polysaccharide export outer membrane protein
VRNNRSVIATDVARAAVCVALVAACGHPAPDYPYSKLVDPRFKELVLGVGDVIGITVYNERGLDTEVTVRADGNITMPLVGDVKASGETPNELKGHIGELVGKFVKVLSASDVQVAVKAWHSYRFRIDGEVVKPGVYPQDQYVTVADAIALAGGPTRFAHRDDIKVFRIDPTTHKTTTIPIDYDLLTSGKRPDMNFWILSGDAINIP